MNYKNKLIASFIFFSIVTIFILNVKNPEKTKFYLFTSKTEELSIGNLVTITFISGFTFSSLLTLISKNKSQELLDESFTSEEWVDNSDKNKSSQEYETDRPPERDIRESQPTISVNYRFVDRENNSYRSNSSNKTKNNLNNDENDWENKDNEW